MIRLTNRRLMAMTIAAGALTVAAGASAAGMVATSAGHPGAGSHGAVTADPFLCVAYGENWGICVGPPTN